MSPKVSVCIVCYNHENYVGDAIQSVLDQTFKDFELIILNNGSTDNSLKVIESFKDPRIKVESIYPNKQSTFGGMYCIEKAVGEYIALLCSDDIWEKDKLEKQVKYLDEHPECGVVFTRVQPFDQYGKNDYSMKNIYNKHFNLQANRTRFEWLRSIFINAEHSFCCSSSCFRKECIDKYGNFDIRTKHIQDFLLWTGILLHKEAYIIDEKLTKMRFFKHFTNLSAMNHKTFVCSVNEENILFDKFKEIKDLDTFLKIFPETKDMFRTIDEKYIPFYLAILGVNITATENFDFSCVQLLYEIYKDKQMQEDLKKDLDFDFMNLYKIASDNGGYNLPISIDYRNVFYKYTAPIINFLSHHIFGVFYIEDEQYYKLKIFGILKTNLRFSGKKNKNKKYY